LDATKFTRSSADAEGLQRATNMNYHTWKALQ